MLKKRIVLILLVITIMVIPAVGHDRDPGNVAFKSSSSTRYDVFQNTTWYIGSDTYVNDTSVYLKADLIVNASCNLTLQNTTIEMDLSSHGEYRVLLNQGSRLSLSKSSIVNKTSFHQGFYGTGCVFEMIDSELRGFGGDGIGKGSKGVELVNSVVGISVSNITMGDYGLYAINCGIDVIGSRIYSHINHGLYAEKGEITIKGSIIYNNLDTGMWLKFLSNIVMEGVGYEHSGLKNNNMDLRIDRTLSVTVKDREGVEVPEATVVVSNNQSGSSQGDTGTPAAPVEFNLRAYTIVDGVATDLSPFSVVISKAGYEQLEHEVTLDSNKAVEYTLYPQGFFDSALNASIRVAAATLELNTTSWAAVNVSNSAYIARNITVALRQNGTILDWGWEGDLEKGEWAVFNFTWTVNSTFNNLSVVVDAGLNATEPDRTDNVAWVWVRGRELPRFSIDGPRKVYLNETNRFHVVGPMSTMMDAFEYRYNTSGDPTIWNKTGLLDMSVHEIMTVNLSVQAKNYDLLGPWSEEIDIEVFKPRLPVANITYWSVTGEYTPFNQFTFNASGSYWHDFDEVRHTDLIYNWDLKPGLFPGKAAEVTMRFDDDTTYNMTLSVTDPEGRTSLPVSVEIKLSNLPPVIRMDTFPLEIEADLPYVLHLEKENTSDPDDLDSEMNYTWVVDGKEYYGEKVDIEFTRSGEFEIVLTVTDGDNATDQAIIPVSVTDTSEPDDDDGIFGTACIALVFILVLIIMIALGVFLFLNPEKFYTFTGRGLKIDEKHLKLNKGKKQDFLIIKHPRKDMYRKYELYNVMDDEEHTALCVVWESAADEEWRIVGSLAGAKDTVINDINTYLDRDTGIKYSVDYWGNGKIVSNKPTEHEKDEKEDPPPPPREMIPPPPKD